jgi:hypothetical protein
LRTIDEARCVCAIDGETEGGLDDDDEDDDEDIGDKGELGVTTCPVNHSGFNLNKMGNVTGSVRFFSLILSSYINRFKCRMSALGTVDRR